MNNGMKRVEYFVQTHLDGSVGGPERPSTLHRLKGDAEEQNHHSALGFA